MLLFQNILSIVFVLGRQCVLFPGIFAFLMTSPQCLLNYKQQVFYMPPIANLSFQLFLLYVHSIER